MWKAKSVCIIKVNGLLFLSFGVLSLELHMYM